MQLYLSLLRERRTALIWAGETLNAFGSGLTLWALAWLLLRTYPTQPLLAALVLSVLSVSSLVGTVVLGAWLDVWDRRRTLVFCNFALALLAALLPIAAHTTWGPFGGSTPLLVLVAAIGVLRSLPAPALSATLPQLVRPDRLTALQALFNLTWMTGELFAAAVAGVLISGAGVNAAFWTDAATFLVAGVTYVLLRFPAQPVPDVLLTEGTRFGPTGEVSRLPEPIPEGDLPQRLNRVLTEHHGVFTAVSFYPRNVERVANFAAMAAAHGRRLAVHPETYALLSATR